MLVLETIRTPSIAQLSYLIGDDDARTAAVIDPRPDAEIYLELAQRHGLAITHVFETHVHADFMSGARSLVARTGGAARLCASVEGGARYGFEVAPVRDGDRFAFGSTVLTARHTPGHTPEHLAFLASESASPDEPWGVFSGDALFVHSAGRPDLLHGDARADALPDQLFDTLRRVFRDLDDGVLLFPGHGAGSGCGAGIADRPLSTLGHEKRHNPCLSQDDREGFKSFIASGTPPEPEHYARLKLLNGQGPPVLTATPACPGLEPSAFAEQAEDGATQLVDVRDMLAFGSGHIPGAIHIGDAPELSEWAGRVLDPERLVLLVLPRADALDEVLRRLLRVGLTRFAGYLAGGMGAWEQQGRPLRRVPQWSVHDLHEAGEGVQLVDVRSPSEYAAGHVPGARHVPVTRAAEAASDGLDASLPTATFCGSGYRASIASSLLARSGFERVRNVVGSWKAWTAAGYPTES